MFDRARMRSFSVHRRCRARASVLTRKVRRTAIVISRVGSPVSAPIASMRQVFRNSRPSHRGKDRSRCPQISMEARSRFNGSSRRISACSIAIRSACAFTPTHDSMRIVDRRTRGWQRGRNDSGGRVVVLSARVRSAAIFDRNWLTHEPTARNSSRLTHSIASHRRGCHRPQIETRNFASVRMDIN